MKQLQNLQHTFQQCVLNPDNSLSTAWISASGRAAPELQLSIYSHAYAARLKEVLANDYPAMLMAIGDEPFYQLAEEYIQNYPSQYFSLRDFGRNMADFILIRRQQNESSTDLSWQDRHWLYELATFEWALGQAFDSSDDTLFSEKDMAAIVPEAWPSLKFKLHSSVQRLDFEWNTPEMWQALTDDKPKKVTASRETASPWLIWREQLITRFRSMQKDEQLALDTIRKGGDFNQVCEALVSLINEEDVPMHAASLLKGWISQGLISGIE